jgi:hypothetical protein
MSDRLLEELESALGELKAVTRERVEGLASQHQAGGAAPEPRANEPSKRPPSGEELAKGGLIRVVSIGATTALGAHSSEQFRGVGRIARFLSQIKLRLRPLLGHWR